MVSDSVITAPVTGSVVVAHAKPLAHSCPTSKPAVRPSKKPYSVNVYLSKKLIENYRKRKAFLEQIKAAADSEQPLYCFFYGVTPELKQVPSKKNPEQTFGVFSANIENLDHLIIREAPGVE